MVCYLIDELLKEQVAKLILTKKRKRHLWAFKPFDIKNWALCGKEKGIFS